MHKEINGSYLVFDEHVLTDCVWDYKAYVLSLLSQLLQSCLQKCIILFMMDVDIPASLGYRVVRIGVNFEHTLIDPGVGQMEADVPNGDICITSKVALAQGGNYYLRLTNYKQLLNSDLIIDYSFVNVYNIRKTNMLWEYEDKMLRLSPLLYPIDWTACERPIDTLTTFVGRRDRRDRFLQRLLKYVPHHTSVTNMFDPHEKRQLYRKTKVMINIHQCLFHNTFEEIRVMPSLLCGTLVVSEDTPLREVIPYQHMVVWSPPELVVETTLHVLDHYKEYCEEIFTEQNRQLLEGIHNQDRVNLRSALFPPIE